jgi:hypothetical protein
MSFNIDCTTDDSGELTERMGESVEVFKLPNEGQIQKKFNQTRKKYLGRVSHQVKPSMSSFPLDEICEKPIK